MTTKPADEIFVYRGEDFKALPARPMREGFLGTNLEDALQKLLEQNPNIIPGAQIASSDPDLGPPKFMLLRREIPVSGWSVDHLFVDQYSVPTLLEAKLIQNPDSKRKVIGQIIEYAANASDCWSGGRAREAAAKYYRSLGKDLSRAVEQLLDGNSDEEQFWQRFEDKLESGCLRLIIAADKIRPEVRRMIEYLNSEMESVEVLGLELALYGDDGESFVVVPRLIGESQLNIDRKSESRKTRKWSQDQIEQEIAGIDKPKLRERITRLFNLAVEYGAFRGSTPNKPRFQIKAPAHKSAFLGIWLDGGGHIRFVNLYDKYDKGGDEMERKIFKMATETGLIDPDTKLDEVKDGRRFNKSIAELEDAGYERLFDLVAENLRSDV